MYEIIKQINETTFYGIKGNLIYVLKRISLEELSIYKKLMQINNPNIVKIIEATTIDDSFYIVEQYINGITLKEYLDTNGVLDDIVVKKIALGICNGLSEIHKNGIVHRDINPSNIMIDSLGNPVIIDFGISRTEKHNRNSDTQILGTQGYAAPEQYGFKQTSDKADIYSLGVLMNYMKTLSLPNESITNGAFSSIVRKCIQIDESNRYQNIDSLIADISKKHKIRQMLRMIPGFRKSIWWHSLIAGAYYILWLLATSVCVGYSTRITEAVSSFALFFFAFGLPVPILTNFNGWVDKFVLTQNSPKASKITLQIVATIAAVLLGLVSTLLDIKA